MSLIVAIAMSNVEVEIHQCLFVYSESVANAIVKWSKTRTNTEANVFLGPPETFQGFGYAQKFNGVAGSEVRFVKGEMCEVGLLHIGLHVWRRKVGIIESLCRDCFHGSKILESHERDNVFQLEIILPVTNCTDI